MWGPVLSFACPDDFHADTAAIPAFVVDETLQLNPARDGSRPIQNNQAAVDPARCVGCGAEAGQICSAIIKNAPVGVVSHVRKWWNWQTHHLEGVAPKGVGVQIPPSAPLHLF
jgi:hypothetical protein